MQSILSRSFVVSVILCAAVSAFTLQARASSEVTECDVLVSHPSDPDRVTDGVSSSAVDNKQGIAACKTAVANDSENPRLNYLLARVLFYDGQTDAAIPYLETAAAGDYRQAQFVLGYILAGGRGGVQPDLCRAELLWLKSARSGRIAALVSYPHHVARGLFDACELHATPIEIESFLTQAKARQLDYYQKMLVDDIAADLKIWTESR